MRLINIFFVGLTFLVSCSSHENNASNALTDNSLIKVNQTDTGSISKQLFTEIESCEDINVYELDTLFEFGINFHLRTLCNDKVQIFDTISFNQDTSIIHGYREISYDITIKTSKGMQKIIVTKESFGDSLATDMKEKGILINPWEVKFEKSDSTIRMRSFIGFPESDFGDILYYKINSKGKLTVLAIEEPKLGE